MTELMYFDNPMEFEFETTVLDVQPQDKGLFHVTLDKTYFYPTGGGQSHDIGMIDSKPVVDVVKSDNRVVHIIKGEIGKGVVQAKVDRDRRIRNMQAHTGQHLLSAAFVRILEAETVAVKMNFDMPSTVDIELGDLSPEQIKAVETVANQVIFENRAVKSYFLAPDSSELDKLRRAVKFDKVSGDVRIVEIVDWDMSACAGTHLPFTGMLGVLKILKVENYKGGSRIHFAVGFEALEQFRHYYEVATDVSNLLSSGTKDIVSLVQKLQDERQSLTKQVAEFQEVILMNEKKQLLQEAILLDDLRLVIASFDDKANDALKTLGNLLREESQTVGVFVNAQGNNTGVAVCASDDSGIHAGNLLKSILEDFGGRGGGGQPYAQGICKDFSDTSAIVDSIEAKVQEMMQS